MLQSSRVFFSRYFSGAVKDIPVVCPKTKGGKFMPYKRLAWQALYPEIEGGRVRPSFWTSDFKFKHLLRTGNDFKGAIPKAAPPGAYQNTNSSTTHLELKQTRPNRETRALPMMPVTARSVYEHRKEVAELFHRKTRTDFDRLMELRDQEFFDWYSKLQRVRGRWCRAQGVTSRGNYGKAVDASEIWG